MKSTFSQTSLEFLISFVSKNCKVLGFYKLTKSKLMRRCFEPNIALLVALYLCVFTIFQQNVFKHSVYYNIEWTASFWKISLQTITAFTLTQDDYAPEQMNIFLKIRMIFFKLLFHFRFLLYLFLYR